MHSTEMDVKQIIFSGNRKEEMTFEEVREAFKPMLIAQMRRTNNKSLYNKVEEDDFMQELEIELWRAFVQYEPEKGFCFSTYLHYKLLKGTKAATYSRYAQKNQHNGLFSMNAPMGEHDLRLEDMFASDDSSMTDIEYQELVTLIKDNLNENEEEIFKIIVNRSLYTVQNYADKYEITRQAANQRVVKLRNKLRTIVSEQYLDLN